MSVTSAHCNNDTRKATKNPDKGWKINVYYIASHKTSSIAQGIEALPEVYSNATEPGNEYIKNRVTIRPPPYMDTCLHMYTPVIITSKQYTWSQTPQPSQSYQLR
jgi:hypothetical protein